MRYLFAVICPPLAVLSCGRLNKMLLSVLLTLCFWVPGAIHALLVVRNHHAEQREGSVGREMRQHRLNSVVRRV